MHGFSSDLKLHLHESTYTKKYISVFTYKKKQNKNHIHQDPIPAPSL